MHSVSPAVAEYEAQQKAVIAAMKVRRVLVHCGPMHHQNHSLFVSGIEACHTCLVTYVAVMQSSHSEHRRLMDGWHTMHEPDCMRSCCLFVCAPTAALAMQRMASQRLLTLRLAFLWQARAGDKPAETAPPEKKVDLGPSVDGKALVTKVWIQDRPTLPQC